MEQKEKNLETDSVMPSFSDFNLDVGNTQNSKNPEKPKAPCYLNVSNITLAKRT